MTPQPAPDHRGRAACNRCVVLAFGTIRNAARNPAQDTDDTAIRSESIKRLVAFRSEIRFESQMLSSRLVIAHASTRDVGPCAEGSPYPPLPEQAVGARVSESGPR